MNFFKGKDCLGSINMFRNYFNGVLLMNRAILAEFVGNMQNLNEIRECIEMKESSDVTYKVHDKWGRPNTFILFD
jgi:hypothetical protein